jgi:hypothetical protein
MNDPLHHPLREAGWRRKLTVAEAAELDAWLSAHPEQRADWEAETGLNQALNRLPDAPVPTNFTARVLDRIDAWERERLGSDRRGRGWRWSWRSLMPRVALMMLLVGLGVFSYERHQATQRARLARNVAAVSDMAALPDPEFLENFEDILRLGQTPSADGELLALLQ